MFFDREVTETEKEQRFKILRDITNRGSLVTASDLVFYVIIYCYKLYQHITKLEGR